MELEGDDGRAQSTPAGGRQGLDVVDAAVAIEVERHRGRDGLVVQGGDDQVERRAVDGVEEAGREVEDP